MTIMLTSLVALSFVLAIMDQIQDLIQQNHVSQDEFKEYFNKG